MKKLIGIATAAVFGFGIFTTYAKAETVVTTDVLNVRENPTTDSQVVGKLSNGDKLDVTNTENGWSQIKLNGKEVFVSAEFTKNIYYVMGNVLNVRAEANTDSEILGTLKKDDMIETTSAVQNGWLQFEYNGKKAYIYAPFLTGTAPIIEKQETSTPTKTEAQENPAAKPVVKAAETNVPSGGRELAVVATAYTADPKENGGTYGGRVLTKSGYDISHTNTYRGMRILATDPKVIPTGSIVTVKLPNQPAFKAIALDTGGAIKNNRIDILVGSNSDADKIGKTSATVTIEK
ncbi:SH3 domain-containing protein (plasmid) [Bacillus mycoides]|nr:SH3 domain-containing protein [Bacillus mycoides]